MDRKRLAGRLAAEMHMDTPGLAFAVQEAVMACGYLDPLDMAKASAFIAAGIEDALCYSGNAVDYELTPKAVAGLKGKVARALAKAIVRVQGVGSPL